MAKTLQLFVQRLLQIEGVNQYILIKNDGDIISHNVKIDYSETLSSMIVFCCFSGDALKSDMGFSKFKYLILLRKSKEHLIVFPLKKFFLGILQHPDMSIPDLVDEVTQFIDGDNYKK